jgi:hypothetical protein
MTDNDYVSFLLVGVLFIVVDGMILYRGAKQYLAGSAAGATQNASMARMVIVVFHLVALGVLALLSLVDIGGAPAAVVGRLGIFLLLMAVAHAITISVLSRQRENQSVESRLGRPQRQPEMDVYQAELARDSGMTPRPVEGSPYETTVTPVPGQDGAAPQVSPTLEQRGPYSA